MPISSTRLSCPLLGKAYVTSPVGSAFDPGESASIYSTLTPSASIFPLPYTPLASGLADCRASLSSAPASPTATGTALQQGSFAPRTLLRFSATTTIHHHLVVSHFPGLAGYMTYPAPSISRWDEDGFSSCLACPCHRAVPNTPPECLIASVSIAMIHAAFAQQMRARPPVPGVSRPSMGSLTLRPGNSLTILKMALSVGFIRFVSSTDATQSTGF